VRGILGHVNIDVTQNQELGFTRGQSPKTNFGEWRGIAKSFHEKAGECQVCFSFFLSFFLSCKDVFVLLFLPVSSCP
jgi:hypothetical protein